MAEDRVGERQDVRLRDVALDEHVRRRPQRGRVLVGADRHDGRAVDGADCLEQQRKPAAAR